MYLNLLNRRRRSGISRLSDSNESFDRINEFSTIEDKCNAMKQECLIDESLRSYVPLKATLSHHNIDASQCFPLENRVIDFIENEQLIGTPTLLIYGVSGAGKSLFCSRLEKIYWQKYKPGSIIPLFISLSSLKESGHNAIEQYLKIYGFTEDDIALLKNEKNTNKAEGDNYSKAEVLDFEEERDNLPRLLIILDGYDEIKESINIHDAYSLSAWPNIKVIITCCSDYLDGKSKTDLFSSKKAAYQEFFISPFDDEQVKLFILESFRRWQDSGNEIVKSFPEPSYFANLMLSIEDLKDIIKSPVTLEVFMNVLPDLLEKNITTKKPVMPSNSLSAAAEAPKKSIVDVLEKITRYEIYSLLMNNWCKSEGTRLRSISPQLSNNFDSKCSVESCSTSIACFMFEQDTQTINIGSTSEEGGLDFFLSNIGVISRILGPVTTIDNACYGFIHKSIQDFLVAKAMLSDIRAVMQGNIAEISSDSILNRAHIQNYPSVLLFILDEITKKELNALEEIMLSTRADTKEGRSSSIDIASANAATIYVRTRYTQSISHKDWSYTQIMGADISGAYFYGMDFTGCNWRDVVARSIQMRLCNLRNIDLTDFYIGEYGALLSQDKGVSVLFANNRYVFSTSRDNTFRMWNIITGDSVCVFVGHQRLVSSVFADNKYVFSGSWDLTVRVWDISTGESVRVLKGHKSNITSVFANNGYLFSGSLDHSIRAWNIEKGLCFRTFLGHEREVTSVHAIDDSVFSGSGDKTIRVWSIATGYCMHVFQGHEDMVTGVYALGDYVFSCSSDTTIRMWDARQGNCLSVLKEHIIRVKGIFANGDYLYSYSEEDKVIKEWDIKTGYSIMTLSENDQNVRSIYARGTHIFSVDSDNTIRIRDLSAKKMIYPSIKNHAGSVTKIFVRGNYIFSGSKDNTIKAWDIESGECLLVFKGHNDWVTGVYASDKHLFSCSRDKTARMWSLETGECLRVFDSSKFVFSSVYLIGDSVLLSSWNNHIEVYNSLTGSSLGELKGHSNITTEVFSYQGYVLSGGWDKAVRVWDINKFECLHILSGHSDWVSSIYASGDYIISGSFDKTIRVWSTKTWSCQFVLEGHDDHVLSVYASRDYIFSCSADKTIRIWGISSGKCINTLKAHSSEVIGVSVKGCQLISADESGMIIVWDISSIEDVKILKTFARKVLNHSFHLVDNEGDHIHGLSARNQKLFEQSVVKNDLNESKRPQTKAGIEESRDDSNCLHKKSKSACVSGGLTSEQFHDNKEDMKVDVSSEPLTSQSFSSAVGTIFLSQQDAELPNDINLRQGRNF